MLRKGARPISETHPLFASRPTIGDSDYHTRIYLRDPRISCAISYASNTKQEFAHMSKSGDEHVWRAVVNNVIAKHSGCAVCCGRKAVLGYNDIATTHPHIAFSPKVGDDDYYTRVHFLDPAVPPTLPAGSNKRHWFTHHVAQGPPHRWRTIVLNVVVKGAKCHFCSRQRLLEGFNDAATTHPMFSSAPEPGADDYYTRTYFKGAATARRVQRGTDSVETFAHRAKDGTEHTWRACVYSVIGRGDGCPTCTRGRSEGYMADALARTIGACDASTTHYVNGLRTRFDYLHAGLGGIGGECDGDHHFPHSGTVYGIRLDIDFPEQHRRDAVRNKLVRLMLRIPTPTEFVPVVPRPTFERVCVECADAMANARDAGASGLMMHPLSRASYLRAYDAVTVDAAVALFEKHAGVRRKRARPTDEQQQQQQQQQRQQTMDVKERMRLYREKMARASSAVPANLFVEPRWTKMETGKGRLFVRTRCIRTTNEAVQRPLIVYEAVFETHSGTTFDNNKQVLCEERSDVAVLPNIDAALRAEASAKLQRMGWRCYGSGVSNGLVVDEFTQ